MSPITVTQLPRKTTFALGTVLVTTIILAMTTSRFYGAELMSPPLRSSAWNGWDSIDKIFVFGDSWSDIGFSLTGRQPEPDWPFGNGFPSWPDQTAVYGAHWFMYLATEFNQSFIETYCLARSSGTVNASITPHGTDFIQDLQERFLPVYGGPSESGWHSSSTLFAMFFGVNDISMVAEEWEDDIPMILDNIFATYLSLVEELYRNEARSFLFINLPPMDRAPPRQESLKPIVQQWNVRLRRLVDEISAHKDISVFLFDLHSLFGQVLDDPTSFPQTALYKNTIDNCDAYGWAMPVDLFVPSCIVPLKEYLWLNALHPTYPIHEAMAAQIAKMLGG